MSFNPATLKFWRCPKCHSTLVQRDANLICTGPDCRLQYEIRQDIPVMLIDQATVLPEERWRELTSVGSPA